MVIAKPPAKAKHGYVLIVDDEEENIALLGRTFRSDAHLWVARDGKEARMVLAENKVDLILADQRMPGETGVQLLQFVATNYPSIARFMLTAYGDSDEVVDACQSGVVQRFFLKPFSPSHLKGAVLEQLRRGGAARPSFVLVGDDDAAFRRTFREVLSTHAIQTVEAADGAEAIEQLMGGGVEVAVIDLNMPKVSGDRVLQKVQNTDPDLPVILVSTQPYAVGINFLQAGAFDYMAKPVKTGELIMRVERALLARQQALENKRLLEELSTADPSPEIVAQSEGMSRVLDQCRMVAAHEVNVLVTGETGTGKEVVARFIHQSSRRASGPFIAVNCGALPDNLVESQLFGHQRGAFTDAKETQRGIFEAADGGVVFLDEVAELSLQSQVRLLRVLETREVTRLGATQPMQVNVRVVAATHRDLEKMVSQGLFRQDLFYRLDAFRVAIPPLRERPDDIRPLIELATTRFCARNKMPPPQIDEQVIREALSYNWPGNIRELFHVVERALIVHTSERLESLGLATPAVPGADGGELGVDASRPMMETLSPLFEELEKKYLMQLLTRFDGRLGECAVHAGIHRKSLYNKLRRYKLSYK